jgi:hypothetical protein
MHALVQQDSLAMLAADASLQPLGALADRGHFSDAQTTLAAATAVYSRCALTSTGSAERCSKAAAIAALLTALQQCSVCTDSKEKSVALAAAQRTAAVVASMPPASLRAPLCPLLLDGAVHSTTTAATAASSSAGTAAVVAAVVPVAVHISSDAAVLLPISTKIIASGGDAPAPEPTAEKQQQFARQFSKQHSTVTSDDDDAAAAEYAFDYDDNDNTATAADVDATTADSTDSATTKSIQEADAAVPASVAAVAAACVTAALRSAVAVATVRILLRKGSRVTSRYRGGVSEYAGTVQRVHANGTYDVHYDDGEGELRCAAKHFKLLDATAGTSTVATGNSAMPVSALAAVAAGAIVYSQSSKVCVQGRFNSWAGTVLCSSSGRAGAYDIEYDDGVIEACVPAHLLRAAVTNINSTTAQTSESSSDSSALCIGDRIEARYKGRERYYPGKITAVNASADTDADAVTYDIEYDDDEHESSVAAQLVQREVPTATAAAALADIAAESADSGTDIAASNGLMTAVHDGKASAAADNDSSMRIAEQLQRSQGVDSGG